MHAQQALLFLAAAGAATASVLVERVPLGAIEARTVSQGWSIQAASAPGGTTSCGGGSFCPSSLKCNPAANDEVAACCTGSDCRGAVEGAPSCADSSWSLWTGLDGNGFCCAVGQVGIYDYHNPVAGTCVGSAPAGATTAQLVSTGSGSSPAPATSGASAPASPSPSAAGSSAASAATTAAPAGSTSAAAVPVAGTATSAAAAATTAAANASTTGSSTPKATNGAERLASGFAVVVLAVGAMLAL